MGGPVRQFCHGTSPSISTAGLRVPSYFSSPCPQSRHPACHPALARHPAPARHPACYRCAWASLLLFPLDCACGGGARGGGELIRRRLVGEGKLISLVLLAVGAGVIKEGSGFLPSQVLGRAIMACAVKACAIKACNIKSCAIKAGATEVSSGSCHQGECEFLKQVRSRFAGARSGVLFILYR